MLLLCLQLLDLVTFLPAEAGAFVSIYESGSSDATPDWLMMLRTLLRALQV